MAANPGFTQPHPRSWYQIMHQARREYAASGGAAVTAFDPIATHAASATTPVTGNVFVAPGAGLALPTTVSISLVQASTTKSTQSVAVAPTTGAFTATFAGAICTAGTANARAVLTSPANTTNSANFTLT